MNVAIFGGFGKVPLNAGWTKETAVAVFGGGEFDVSDAPPADGARILAVAVLGGITITVPAGTRVRMHGFSLFGSREVKGTGATGPELAIKAVAIFGSVEVKYASEAAPA